jgi:hypothetical protein
VLRRKAGTYKFKEEQLLSKAVFSDVSVTFCSPRNKSGFYRLSLGLNGRFYETYTEC